MIYNLIPKTATLCFLLALFALLPGCKKAGPAPAPPTVEVVAVE